jgi:hypothetical protein
MHNKAHLYIEVKLLRADQTLKDWGASTASQYYEFDYYIEASLVGYAYTM